jgi:cytochrome P450 family 6
VKKGGSGMNFSEVLFYVVLPAVAGLFFFLKKKYSYFEDRGIPHIKPSLIFGNLPLFGAQHMGDALTKLYNEAKNKDVIAGFYMFVNRWIVVTDLELVKMITVKDFHIFHDRGFFVNEEKEPLTGHLFAITGEKWRFLRNKLSPALTSGKIKMMYNTISDKGETFVKAIELEASKAESIDMKDLSNRFTIDVISNCAFGIDANTLNYENNEILQLFKTIFGADLKGLLRTLFIFGLPKLSKRINLKQYTNEVTKFFNDVVGGAIKDRETKNIQRNDFLNMLIDLKNKGSIDSENSNEARKLTLDEVIAQACRF